MQNSPTGAAIGFTSRLPHQSFLPLKKSPVLRRLLSPFALPTTGHLQHRPCLGASKPGEMALIIAQPRTSCALARGRFTHPMRAVSRALGLSAGHGAVLRITAKRWKFRNARHIRQQRHGATESTRAEGYTVSRVPPQRQEQCEMGETQSFFLSSPAAPTVAWGCRDGRRMPHFFSRGRPPCPRAHGQHHAFCPPWHLVIRIFKQPSSCRSVLPSSLSSCLSFLHTF